MTEEHFDVEIVKEETPVNPFQDLVKNIAESVFPTVFGVVQDHIPNLKGECKICKKQVGECATELNVFEGGRFTRYYLCDDCTNRILNTEN